MDNRDLTVRISFGRLKLHMEQPLTPKQKRMLDAIRTYHRFKGYMPSVRDLMKLTKSAIGTVHDHLETLKRKGWIKADGTARGIQLVEDIVDRQNLVSVPVVGTIAAGKPIEAIQIPEDPVTLPKSAARLGAFALKVRGDSMIDDHIMDGDLVIIKPQPVVSNGEIAVALLEDNTATLKRVYKEKSRIRLQPANAALKPIFVKRLKIQGKVTAVLRLHKR